MLTVEQLVSILDAVARSDNASVWEICRDVAEHQRRRRHFSAAHQITEAVEIASRTSGADLIGTADVPLVPLAVPPEILVELSTASVVVPSLPTDLLRQIDEFAEEWLAEPALRQRGLRPRRSVLLYGPPGWLLGHVALKMVRDERRVPNETLGLEIVCDSGQVLVVHPSAR